MTLSRRGFLAVTGTGALGWALTGRSSPAAGQAFRPVENRLQTLPAGLPLPLLPDLPLTPGPGGSLTGVLTAAPLVADPAGTSSLALAPPLGYDGGIPGPVIRLRDRQSARITFANRTAATTNLHLHGLHIPPAVDAPFAHVAPGAQRDYPFTLPAGRAATYWYHPHMHGDVENELLRGLYGPLVVEPAVLPAPLAGAEEHILVLSTRLDQKQVLVNGAASPTLAATATRLRLRVVNAGVQRTLVLQVREAGGQPRPFWLVATDAGFIDHPVPLTKLALSAGERVELLLDVGPATGTLTTADDGAPLLAVTGPDAPLLAAPAGHLATVERLRPPKHATHRIINLTQAPDGSYRMDGKLFSEDRVDQRVGHNATEVWEVRNRTDNEHPFHLHTWPFQILTRNGRKESLLAWRDVVLVPPHQSVQLAVRFDSFRGKTVYHCHIAGHEDAGMMGVVQVV